MARSVAWPISFNSSLIRCGALGGRTVFPLLGLTVKPPALSLLLWYNLDPTGQPDSRSLHAGCPTVTGHKWILNKWINRDQHWTTHPCHRNKHHQAAFNKWSLL